MNSKVIYSGTFDPITFGHLDIIKRASRLFDHVIVGVAHYSDKKTLFSFDERIELVKTVLADVKNVEVIGFEGLLVDFAKANDVGIIVRGLRVISDFDYEFGMASMNRKMAPELETLFISPDDQYTSVSSSLVRVIAANKGDTSKFVPPVVIEALKNKYP